MLAAVVKCSSKMDFDHGHGACFRAEMVFQPAGLVDSVARESSTKCMWEHRQIACKTRNRSDWMSRYEAAYELDARMLRATLCDSVTGNNENDQTLGADKWYCSSIQSARAPAVSRCRTELQGYAVPLHAFVEVAVPDPCLLVSTFRPLTWLAQPWIA